MTEESERKARQERAFQELLVREDALVDKHPTPPAGWYPHATITGSQRYWDGKAWTDHVAPMPSPPDAGVLGGEEAALMHVPAMTTGTTNRLLLLMLVFLVGTAAAIVIGTMMAAENGMSAAEDDWYEMQKSYTLEPGVSTRSDYRYAAAQQAELAVDMRAACDGFGAWTSGLLSAQKDEILELADRADEESLRLYRTADLVEAQGR